MWIIAAFCLIGSAAAMGDLNCTSGGKYTEQATICSNNYADSSCRAVYLNDTAVQPGGADERPAPCFNGTNGPSEDIKQMAIANCPKLCGYCCLTPAYKCANAPYPRLNCATITARMCKDPSWREVIAQDCPAACGFCLLGGCVDSAPDCETQPTICVTNGMEAFIAANCQRTCGLCNKATTKAPSVVAPSPSASCVDASTSCASWIKNNFCTNTFYTPAQRKQYCARSCNLC